MEQVFSYIISLGASVMMPILFTIIGLCIGLKFGRSLKSGLYVLDKECLFEYKIEDYHEEHGADHRAGWNSELLCDESACCPDRDGKQKQGKIVHFTNR